ncbi:MAG TPA: ABC transporter permease [Terriglobales bacterium]|nr:ABC transporter permease [Terriglobales bacterium]
MHTAEAIRMSLQSLWANKLRSVLTLLGVVIGVAAVIAVVTFVNGINGYVASRIFRLGADVFIVGKMSAVITNADQFIEGQKRKDLTMDDYRAVAEGCVHCTAVGAGVISFNGHVAYGNQSSGDSFIRGYDTTMQTVADIEIVEGRAMNNTDVEHASQVAVIGQDILENVMGGADPIDKEIRIDGQLYRVIGVGKKQGKTLGQSLDNYAIIPITAYLRQYGTHNNSIKISGKSDGVGPPLETAMDETRAILRARRHDQPGHDDSFAIETNQSFLGMWSAISGSFFIAMIAIASISLIVGGIVIMNIMLVSVTERTREIGIRKAMGARSGDVLRQFLIESSTIALVGGILGIFLGIGVAKGITLAIGMPSVIKLWAIGASLLVSASVGIFFGVYPARRAARLDPIAALRYET